MLSKKTLLERLWAARTIINTRMSEMGLEIAYRGESEWANQRITDVGEDIFEVTTTYPNNPDLKPTKAYFSIDANIVFGSGLFE